MSEHRPFHNPFDVLKSLTRKDAADETTPSDTSPSPAPPQGPASAPARGQSPVSGTDPASARAQPPSAAPRLASASTANRATPAVPRAVVRLERAGRGGKEVTVVEHMALSPAERERWLKALKSQLGCGGVVEGEALVLQGDHRKRLPAILSARGVKKVTVG